ncbi:hypothetical protein GT034_09470 [Streptomyces sp. SID2563]|uniref:hypothetical protein n=1 Tax=Streptomyces sp. SID2563 TaxID=2690255 RepID=UPI00136A58C4|nr:hypothetical protein [Streptomyces sp. SID2563]MYW08571.1 hypothetical protein [Streptomyces sp. SID2563]
MNTEKRLTISELVDEIRSSLTVTDGWVPALSGPAGPTGVLKDAPLSEIVRSLGEFAATPALPSAVTKLLRRAAESAAAALPADQEAAYGRLGAAYAYVLQAHRAAGGETSICLKSDESMP